MRSFPSYCLAVVAVLFTVAPLAARAQSAPDLVAKNLAARGGAEKLAAIASIEFTGKLVAPGDFELSYKETRARVGGRARLDSSIQGLTITQAYDGKVGWKINPFEGRRDPERLSSDEVQALADAATIDGPLLSSKASGSTVTYLGREDVDGTDAFKLRVLEPSGVEYAYYLDPDTYLEIKVIETRKIRGTPHVTSTEFGDYELVEGAYFPFSIESGAADSSPDQRATITIDAARANIAPPDSLFALPTAPASK